MAKVFAVTSTVLAFASVLTVAPVVAVTNADWAWPGMRYDIRLGDYWHSCSVGFPAWDSAGTRYFISAGHCFRAATGGHYLQPGGAGVEIYTSSNHSSPVGFERTYTIPGDTYDDVSLVEIFPGRRLDGIGWQHVPDNPTTGALGDPVCLAGYRHDTPACGTVTGTGVQMRLGDYPWTVSVSTASFCALAGDSGGAVYNDTGAVGIEVSRDTAHNDSGAGTCSSAFIPIRRALDVLRQQKPSLTL